MKSQNCKFYIELRDSQIYVTRILNFLKESGYFKYLTTKTNNDYFARHSFILGYRIQNQNSKKINKELGETKVKLSLKKT